MDSYEMQPFLQYQLLKFQTNKVMDSRHLKNQKLWYLHNCLMDIDFDEIWHTDSYRPSVPYQVAQ